MQIAPNRGVGICATAVDRGGKTVDIRLSARRDVAATVAFFLKTIKSQGPAPKAITLDGYAASHRAVRRSSSVFHPNDVSSRPIYNLD
jgi:IS6 family transposase